MDELGSLLDGETSLQLQRAVIISHPANEQLLIPRVAARLKRTPKLLLALTDL